MHSGDGCVPGWIRLIQPRKKFERIKSRRAADAGTLAEGCEDGRNQAVYMKQRHDIQADIVGSQAQRMLDVAGRCTDVGLTERHDFRPRSGARRVQNQRDIVRPGHANTIILCVGAIFCRMNTEHAGWQIRLRFKFQQLNVLSLRCSDGGRVAVLFDE